MIIFIKIICKIHFKIFRKLHFDLDSRIDMTKIEHIPFNGFDWLQDCLVIRTFLSVETKETSLVVTHKVN